MMEKANILRNATTLVPASFKERFPACKYAKNPAVWVIAFYCIKGTLVTLAGIAAFLFAV